MFNIDVYIVYTCTMHIIYIIITDSSFHKAEADFFKPGFSIIYPNKI